jgi:hypothetical protein
MESNQTKNVALWNQSIALSTEEIVIQKVFEQLKKDFNRCNIELRVNPQSNPNSWTIQLTTILHQLSDNELAHLLYLIDVPETLSNLLRANDTHLEQLSAAIIYRELVKVHSKLSYSSGTNQHNSIDIQ